MRLTPANLISGSYSDDALSWAAMRTVNWLPEVAEVEGTRTVKKLATPPGLSLLVDLGTRAPVRGITDVEGRLFAVSWDSLFEVSNDLAVTNRGSIPGVGRVSMAHNKQGGASAANELAIANGLSGYVYNTDSTVLAQITDSAFEGASAFDYVDGYMSYTDPQGRWWGHSDLNQATQYSSIDRNDAESAPDPIISHIVSHREVIVWGTRTGEFFRNTGAATGTFQRVDGTEMEVGICSTFARARVDNTVCWVGNDLTVYRLNGHAPQRISTRPIEQALSRVDPANVFCFAWEDRGHKVFYITSPGDFTLGFDFSSGIWHERQSYGLDRWRVNCMARWGNRWIAGDYANGLLYELDWDAYMEHGLPMVSITASGYTTADQNKVLCPYAELIFDTGGAESEQVNETALGLSGDVPDGIVTDSGTATYTASGGFVPYSFSIVSGELPGGAVLDGATGVVSYTYATSGSFSWTVRVTDAAGNTADLADSAAVGEVQWASHGWTTNNISAISGTSYSEPVWAPSLGRMVHTTGPIDHDYSSDAVSWSTATGPANRFSSAWSPPLSMFAGVTNGATDTVYSSASGTAWATNSYSGEFYGADAICWADDLSEFFAIGGSGVSTAWRRSSNGTAWTSGVLGASGPQSVVGVARGASVFVAVSNDGPAVGSRISSSPDGLSWSNHASFDTSYYDVRWVQDLGIFIAVGYGANRVIATSANGSDWTNVTPVGIPFDPAGVDYSPELGLVVITANTASVLDTDFYTSPDGVTFTLRSGFPGGFHNRVRWCGAPLYRFVALRHGGATGNGATYSNTVLVMP